MVSACCGRKFGWQRERAREAISEKGWGVWSQLGNWWQYDRKSLFKKKHPVNKYTNFLHVTWQDVHGEHTTQNLMKQITLGHLSETSTTQHWPLFRNNGRHASPRTPTHASTQTHWKENIIKVTSTPPPSQLPTLCRDAIDTAFPNINAGLGQGERAWAGITVERNQCRFAEELQKL